MTSADLLITNARVYTVDNTNPWAEAVVVQGEQIVFVGSAKDADAYRGPKTRVIDGDGNTLLPGFIDSHFHLLWGAETLYGAQLQELTTLGELEKSLHAWADEHPNSLWVLGEGLSYSIPDKSTPLTRHHLDKIVRDRPMALTTYDQHSVIANTMGLEAAGILNGVDEPLPNGQVIVDADGVATGELYEMDAMNFIREARPKPDFAAQIETAQRGVRHCVSLGITSIHNMDGDLEQAALYGYLDKRNELDLRIYMPFWAKPEMDLETVLNGGITLRDRYQSAMLRGGVVKFFMDGVYESYTAVTTDAYPDQLNNYGEPIWPAERFAEFTVGVDKEGLQIATHACGDGAVRQVLDGYETAQKANGRRDSRHRIEHIEVLHPDDLPRFAQLGVIASVQPLHSPLIPNSPDTWQVRVNPTRWDQAFPWQSLREAGAHQTFGSDWPVVSADPLTGFYAALNRQSWMPGQNNHRQTLAETIQGYTKDGAYTEYQETKKGQLKTGMLADLVLLSDDIFAVQPETVMDVSVQMTVCHGRIVYEK